MKRKAQSAAASSRSESAVQPATSVESDEPSDISVSSQPARKRARNSRTAAASTATFLPRKRARSSSGSAEQPATSVPPAQAIAFITCAASSQDFATNTDQRALLKAVNHALEAGATIVNIAFALSKGRHPVDTRTILPALRLVFDATWKGSDGQLAYTVRHTGSVISFLSRSGAAGLSEKILDPEGRLPALMLTVSAPKGRLCMIIASIPELPLTTRRRILDHYFEKAAGTQAKNIVIGGPWQGNCLWLENIAAKQKRPFEFSTNDQLCLLAHAPDCTPVKCFQLDTGGPYSFMCVWESPCSVEQPAPKRARVKANLPLLRLTPSTPLYDKLVDDLESAAQDHSSGGAFLEYIRACCFQDKLLLMDPYGNSVPTPVPLSVKMETLLQTAQKQRQLQKNRLMRRGDALGFQPIHEMHMDPDDMKDILNTWRADVGSYMQASTLANHRELQSKGLCQAAHQLGRSTFSTYQFQLSGCKFLLHKLLELPLIRALSPGSAEQPAESLATSHRSAATKRANILNNLFVAYEEHKRTPQYSAAIERNEEHQAGQLRLSRQIWWDQFNYSEGRKLSQLVKDGASDLFEMAEWQRELVEAFDTRRSHKQLDDVLEKKALKPKPYRGHGTETRSTPCLM
jgi:hypothetical protein